MQTKMLKKGQRMVVRVATRSDAPAMIAFVQRITRETDYLMISGSEFSLSISEEEDYIDSFIKADNRLFLVAEINGRIIGGAHFEGENVTRMRHSGEMGVSVIKDYWGLGVGSALIENLIKWARDTGIIRKINLRVHQDNKRAIALYSRYGFCQEGVKKREFYINGNFYDAILMGMEIN